MTSGGRCFECFRPKPACFCTSIPLIWNKTEVVILQHRRERFHRFNTARIVRKALHNSQMWADYTDNIARRLELKPRAGLLSPGPTATLLSELPVDQRPDQLVVVDGTWHQAKTLIREIQLLQRLPRYQLLPDSPSRFRIRREPNATSLSTVEAVVQALRIVEPETAGLDQLLEAFDKMVETQLAHTGSLNGSRFKQRRSRTVGNIPLALKNSLQNIVVAYGEAAPGERGSKRADLPPVSWVAQRLGDGAVFARTLIPSQPLSDEFLRHLQLARSDFDCALSLTDVRRRWAQFCHPTDIVAFIHPGTMRLFSHIAEGPTKCLVLKSVEAEVLPADVTLPECLIAHDMIQSSCRPFGRAQKRLAATVAWVRHLHSIANG
jgi:DTW domain-containing protein YfiP